MYACWHKLATHFLTAFVAIAAAALSGPAQLSLAASKLNADRNSLPGMIRTFLLNLGILQICAPNAQAIHQYVYLHIMYISTALLTRCLMCCTVCCNIFLVYAGVTDMTAATDAAVLNTTVLNALGLNATALNGTGLNSIGLNATELNDLLQGNTTSGLFTYFPAGLQALFDAVIKDDSLKIHYNTSVTNVTEAGVVTLQNKTQVQFDAVIVTVRPSVAAAILPPKPAALYAESVTGACDVWLFNASILPSANLSNILSGTFTAFVTDNGTIGPPTGYPSLVLRLYDGSPFLSVGAYITPNVSQNSSTTVATEALKQFGFQVHSIAAYRRIAFPSSTIPVPDSDSFGHIYLLGEALAGVGLVAATQYVPIRMQAWFDR